MRETRKMTCTQPTESFFLSALLSFSGGFQDAYTYNLRARVFANAQTGNVVLMSQYFMQREWRTGLYYLFPILAFMTGILIAEQLEHCLSEKAAVQWRQIVLAAETVLLFAVGFLPQRANTIATILVSLSCAMQVQTFRTVNGLRYASTMCIGNLRCGTENLSVFFRTRQTHALVNALQYYGIILVFALGAGLGGVLSGVFGFKTIWGSCALLLAVFFAMFARRPSAIRSEGKSS